MKTPTCDLCDQPSILGLTVFVHDRWWSCLLAKLPRNVKKIQTCQTHLPQNTARMQAAIYRRNEPAVQTGD